MGTASSEVVASPGILATENLALTQRRNSTRVKTPVTCTIATVNCSTEINDSVALNPDGRAMLDRTNKKAHHKNKRLIVKTTKTLQEYLP